MNYQNLTNTQERAIFTRTGSIVGYLYLPKTPTNTVIIYCEGGPMLAPSGNSPIFWKACSAYNVALFVPDYLGSCRSDGDNFSIESCLKTIFLSERFLLGKQNAINIPQMTNYKIKFQQIILMGGSWGGSIAPFYHRKFPNTRIKHIALIAPLVDWKTQCKTDAKESSMEQFLFEIKHGYNNIYRNIHKSNWLKIVRGLSTKWNPQDNIKHLKNLWITVAHGDKDISINYKKSVKYIEALKNNDPTNNQIHFHKLKGITHFEPIEVHGTTAILNQLKQDGQIL